MRSRALLLAVSLCAAGAGADPRPAELAQLEPFLGTWTCDGKSVAAAGQTERKSQGTFSARWELDARWLATSYVETGDAPHRGVDYWTWNPVGKHFVLVGVGSGGGYGAGTSPGWAGDVWTWTSKHRWLGLEVESRTSFKRDGKSLAVNGEVKVDGKWAPEFEALCKR